MYAAEEVELFKSQSDISKKHSMQAKKTLFKSITLKFFFFKKKIGGEGWWKKGNSFFLGGGEGRVISLI